MFGKEIKLFRLLGFEVKIDFSWVILAILITWSLAQGLFPFYYEDFSTVTYWWMGIAGAVGLFISIIFHEFSHSMVARKYGIPMRGITLFIFGGVAQMNEEPNSARSELWMAVAGPAASIVMGIGLLVIDQAGQTLGWPDAVHGVIIYLAVINLVLAAFNLIPAFPLDGGRVLRSALWSWKGNLKRATRISSRIGSGFGILLIVLGAYIFIRGDFIGGVWWFLIGMFLRTASQNSYQQLIMRKELEGESVSRFMNQNPVTVAPSITLNEFVENYVYKLHYKLFPVVDGERLMGCVSVKEVKQVPRTEWKEHTVGEFAEKCSGQNTIASGMDAVTALSMMRRSNNSRLMVVDKDRLVGIITLKDLLVFLSLKVELEDEDS